VETMKKLLYIFLIIPFLGVVLIIIGRGGSSFAQNLVPNWDFETFSSCPTGISQLDLATPWFNADSATPDYYNACATQASMVKVPNPLLGYQQARSGVGYAGFIVYEDFALFNCPEPAFSSEWREYLEVQLTSPLVAGQTYCVQFYVNLATDVKYAAGPIGLYFSDTLVFAQITTPLPFTPQIVNPGVITDTLNWVLIQGSYTAVGGEQYIIIGNFNDDAGTTVQCFNTNASFGNTYAYYYIEDVCVSINCCFAPCDLTVSADSTDETCSASDGTATAIPFGGTSPYTYSWNTVPIQNTSTATGLSAGTYTVIVTDSSGCADTASVTVNNVGGSLSVSTTQADVSCNSLCDGTATENPSGGTSPYTYQWDANAGNQTTQTATGLCAGSYSVTITDASGCTGSASVLITQPALLSVTVSSVDVICNGGNDGTATAIPNGGASPYFYSWSDGQATATATGLSAGTYIVTVTDNNSCSVNTSVTINEPAAITLTTGSTDESCGLSDGTATVSATGGTLPYTYLWNDSLGQTTTTATGLPAGSYFVIVTDSNNCSAVAPVIVNGTGGPALTTTATDVTCNSGNDGAAIVVPSGGILPYTYLWNDSSGQTTATATGLPAGNYDIMVTDSNNCSTIASVTINEPLPIALSTSSTPATCGISDGTATVNASGGTGSFTYSWSPGGQTTPTATGLAAGLYTVVVTDSNGCSLTDTVTVANTGGPVASISSAINVSCFGGNDGGATVSVTGGTTPYTYSWSPGGGSNDTATGLSAGTYTVTVIDAGGCVSTDNITITEPGAIMLNTTVTNVSCFGSCDGDISVVVSGGTAPYTYMWNPNCDIFGCGSCCTGLCAGPYTVFITDANGCDTTASETIIEPPAITLSLSSTQAACGSADGSATVVASGGTGSFTYSWSPAGGTTPSATGLAAGIYTVAVTDANGCSALDSIAVTNIGGATLSITSSAGVSCFGYSDGQATVSASGGTAPYSYSWSPAGGFDSTATGLSAGTYNVTVIDANTCVSIISVIISEPDSIIVTLTADTTICIGDSVTISVSATGGTAPYTYTWDNGLNTDSAHTVSPDSTVTYTVIVFDANLCPVIAQSVTVATNTPLSVTAFGTATICAGDSTLINATASGGDGGLYTYTWSNGAGTGNPVFVSPANTTTYIVTVSDACGSPVAIDSVMITVNPELVLIPTSANICPGENAVLNVSGALSYWWVDETTMDTLGTGSTITVNPSVTTNYLVTGFDGTCTKTDTVGVIVNPAPVANFGFNPPETTITNPTFDFEDLSSPGVVSWIWYFGDGDTSIVENPTHTYADTGTYLVMLIVSDSIGCVDTTAKTVTVKSEYFLFAPNSFTPNKDSKNDVFIPKGIGFDENNFEMHIYDRWGDEIFETDNPSQGWDGRANNGSEIAQQDVYIWLILTRDVHGKRHRYIGHVTLIR